VVQLGPGKITVAAVLKLRKRSSRGRARPSCAILFIKSKTSYKRYFSTIYTLFVDAECSPEQPRGV